MEKGIVLGHEIIKLFQPKYKFIGYMTLTVLFLKYRRETLRNGGKTRLGRRIPRLHR